MHTHIGLATNLSPQSSCFVVVEEGPHAAQFLGTRRRPTDAGRDTAQRKAVPLRPLRTAIIQHGAMGIYTTRPRLDYNK